VLRVTAGTSPIVVVNLRARYNERSDFLITATPVINEASASSTAEILFPHIADGAGWSTQFVLFSGITGQNTSGNVRFAAQTGQSLNLTIR
jgi:hypothetical protein